MKSIKLTQGKVALVDDDMFEYLNQWKWQYDNVTGYARRRESTGKRRSICMHSIILPTEHGFVVDHINRDKLDNQATNLRMVTYAQNNANSGNRKDNTSGYKGVSFDRQKNKWRAGIRTGGKYKDGGFFDDPAEAAKAYDKLAIEIYGEFAVLNFNRTDV